MIRLMHLHWIDFIVDSRGLTPLNRNTDNTLLNTTAVQGQLDFSGSLMSTGQQAPEL